VTNLEAIKRREAEEGFNCDGDWCVAGDCTAHTVLDSLQEIIPYLLSLVEKQQKVVEAAKNAERYVSNLHVLGGEGDCSGGYSCPGCEIWSSLSVSIAALRELDK
jgi:hypothetical protein